MSQNKDIWPFAQGNSHNSQNFYGHSDHIQWTRDQANHQGTSGQSIQTQPMTNAHSTSEQSMQIQHNNMQYYTPSSSNQLNYSNPSMQIQYDPALFHTPYLVNPGTNNHCTQVQQGNMHFYNPSLVNHHSANNHCTQVQHGNTNFYNHSMHRFPAPQQINPRCTCRQRPRPILPRNPSICRPQRVMNHRQRIPKPYAHNQHFNCQSRTGIPKEPKNYSAQYSVEVPNQDTIIVKNLDRQKAITFVESQIKDADADGIVHLNEETLNILAALIDDALPNELDISSEAETLQSPPPWEPPKDPEEIKRLFQRHFC